MLRLIIAVVVLSAASVGCSPSETVAVTGTLVMKSQPVENALVMFDPKQGQGRHAEGVTDASGHFSLSTAKPGDGAMPGEYVVTLAEYYPPGKAPALPKGGGMLPSRFPPKYGDPAQSPLNAKIERGAKNDFNFEVTNP